MARCWSSIKAALSPVDFVSVAFSAGNYPLTGGRFCGMILLMEMGKLQTQVNECLAEAAIAHPWLMGMRDGTPPDLSALDPDRVYLGIMALTGSLIKVVEILAIELDKQNASR